jgi:hypothetical protein
MHGATLVCCRDGIAISIDHASFQITRGNTLARKLCRDLADGGSVQPYIDGTERKSPQLLPQEAAQVVHDAIESYCPQYG